MIMPEVEVRIAASCNIGIYGANGINDSYFIYEKHDESLLPNQISFYDHVVNFFPDF